MSRSLLPSLACRPLTRRRVLAAIGAGALIPACAPASKSADPPLSDRLDALLVSACEGWTSPGGAMLYVSAPRLGFAWSGARAGSANDGHTVPRPDQPMRIASITKPFVAATVLRLVQQAQLDPDAALTGLVSPASETTLRSGGYDPDAITVRMLLQHTSGLYDYAEDAAYFAEIMADPSIVWTRASQLDFAMTHGQPAGAPGTVFQYSDTGYILLGEIVERLTGQGLAGAVRSGLHFDRLGLRSTWWERAEPPPPGVSGRVAQYVGAMDAGLIDPSADLFGGGGLVSTLEDMALFLRALFQGEDILDAEHRGLMTAPTPQSLAAGSPYGMGLGQTVVGGETCHGHGGFWGIVAWHCPARDVTVTAAVTNTDARPALQTLRDAALAETIAAASS